LPTCVSVCGTFYTEDNGICRTDKDCSSVENSPTTCYLIPSCYYKEGAEKCVSDCGSFYTAVDGICRPNECATVMNTENTCSQVPDCYYKEGVNTCVRECGWFYHVIDGVCSPYFCDTRLPDETSHSCQIIPNEKCYGRVDDKGSYYCSSVCNDPSSFYSTEGGVCKVIDCSERIPLSSNSCKINDTDQCYFVSSNFSCVSDCESYDCFI
jgi:hypothetical protein